MRNKKTSLAKSFSFRLFSYIQIFSFLFLTASVSVVFSQQSPRPDRGFMPNGSYSASDLDSVNLQNGNLTVTIPLASLPPIAGGKLSSTVYATYNSKLWNVYKSEGFPALPEPTGCTGASHTNSEVQYSDTGGWRIGGGYVIFFRNAMEDFGYKVPEQHCDPLEHLRMSGLFFKPFLRTPDGAEHELRIAGGYPGGTYQGNREYLKHYYHDAGAASSHPTINSPIRLYTTDGSYISVVYNPPSNPIRWTAFMKDGTQIIQYESEQRIKDSNSNSIRIFSDGEGTHYQDEQTGREIKVTEQSVQYQTVTGVWQTININRGETKVQGKLYGTQDWSLYGGEQGQGSLCYRDVELKTELPVIREIVFPVTETGVAAQKFTFSYNSDSTARTTTQEPRTCSQISNPYTRDASLGLGELNQMTTPSGSAIHYAYSLDGVHDFNSSNENADGVANNVVSAKSVSHDGVTDNWTYNINHDSTGLNGTASVNNPDGSFYVSDYYPTNPLFSRTFAGGGFGGLTYRTVQSNKIITEKHWTRLVFAGGNDLSFGSFNQKTNFNPVVDAEYTTLLDDNGNKVKMSAKTFKYDFNGNLLSTTEYDWFDPALVTYTSGNFSYVQGVPSGVPASATVLRVTDNSYYNEAAFNNSPNIYAYNGSPSILGAIQEIVVADARTRYSYDRQDYGIAPTAGNMTSVSSLDSRGDADPSNDYWVTTGKTYDGYGNVKTSTDANNNTTTFFYEDATHALPTKVVVNPLNGTGELATSTTYDFFTGLVTSATGANGETTYINYINHRLGAVDPFGRPGLKIDPAVTINGMKQHRKTSTVYEDSQLRVIVMSDLKAEGDGLLKNRTTNDQLGRTILTEQSEDGSNYTISTKSVYEQGGRVIFISNPMRAGQATTDGWRRTTKDILGRVVEVNSFTGSTKPDAGVGCLPQTGCTGKTMTAYYAEFTTFWDAGGKVRRTRTDALGRLIRVDEPNASDNTLGDYASPVQPTVYRYDTFGNLTTVKQGGYLQNEQYIGGQTRSFSYNSLSRLISAINPEICQQQSSQCVPIPVVYEYDANGNLTKKIDARAITTNYVYDGLNRVISRSYTGETGAVTQAAAYIYDDPAVENSKGRLTKVSSNGLSSNYNNYDELGRLKSYTQMIRERRYNSSYTYDLSGHIITQIYPSGHVVNYSYDNAGRLSNFSGTLGDGAPRTYSDQIIYSAMGGLSQERLGTETPIYNKLYYNARGQLAEIREGTQPNDASWNRGAIINHYSDNCWGMCANSGMPDNDGNLKRQEHWIPREDQPQPAKFHIETQKYEYDKLNRLLRVFDGEAVNPIWQQYYTYDVFGNRLVDPTKTFQVGVPIWQFGVDPNTNRLTAPQGSTLSYDAAGNLLTDTHSAKALRRTYDAENRMTSETDTNNVVSGLYVYDSDGRRVGRVIGNTITWQVYGPGGELLAEYPENGAPENPQKEYGYRSGELLITATPSSSWGSPPTLNDNPLVEKVTIVQARHITELRQAIDVLRSRLGLSAYPWSTVATSKSLIKADPIIEMRRAVDEALGAPPAPGYTAGLSQGQPIRAKHIQELRDRVLAKWRGEGSSIHWMVADQLGTPRMIFDQGGNLAGVSRHDYLPFGEELFVGSGGRTVELGYNKTDSDRQQFTGQERDKETGLDYFNARHFSAAQGRFTSVDPLAASAKADNPRTWNRYAYVLNNPMKFTDSTGMQPECSDGNPCSEDYINENEDAVFVTKTSIDRNATGLPHDTSYWRVDGSKEDILKFSPGFHLKIRYFPGGEVSEQKINLPQGVKSANDDIFTAVSLGAPVFSLGKALLGKSVGSFALKEGGNIAETFVKGESSAVMTLGKGAALEGLPAIKGNSFHFMTPAGSKVMSPLAVAYEAGKLTGDKTIGLALNKIVVQGGVRQGLSFRFKAGPTTETFFKELQWFRQAGGRIP